MRPLVLLAALALSLAVASCGGSAPPDGGTRDAGTDAGGTCGAAGAGCSLDPECCSGTCFAGSCT